MNDVSPSALWSLLQLLNYDDVSMYIKSLHVPHWLAKENLIYWAKFHNYDLTEKQIIDTCGPPGVSVGP